MRNEASLVQSISQPPPSPPSSSRCLCGSLNLDSFLDSGNADIFGDQSYMRANEERETKAFTKKNDKTLVNRLTLGFVDKQFDTALARYLPSVITSRLLLVALINLCLLFIGVSLFASWTHWYEYEIANQKARAVQAPQPQAFRKGEEELYTSNTHPWGGKASSSFIYLVGGGGSHDEIVGGGGGDFESLRGSFVSRQEEDAYTTEAPLGNPSSHPLSQHKTYQIYTTKNPLQAPPPQTPLSPRPTIFTTSSGLYLELAEESISNLELFWIFWIILGLTSLTWVVVSLFSYRKSHHRRIVFERFFFYGSLLLTAGWLVPLIIHRWNLYTSTINLSASEEIHKLLLRGASDISNIDICMINPPIYNTNQGGSESPPPEGGNMPVEDDATSPPINDTPSGSDSTTTRCLRPLQAMPLIATYLTMLFLTTPGPYLRIPWAKGVYLYFISLFISIVDSIIFQLINCNLADYQSVCFKYNLVMIFYLLLHLLQILRAYTQEREIKVLLRKWLTYEYFLGENMLLQTQQLGRVGRFYASSRIDSDPGIDNFVEDKAAANIVKGMIGFENIPGGGFFLSPRRPTWRKEALLKKQSDDALRYARTNDILWQTQDMDLFLPINPSTKYRKRSTRGFGGAETESSQEEELENERIFSKKYANNEEVLSREVGDGFGGGLGGISAATGEIATASTPLGEAPLPAKKRVSIVGNITNKQADPFKHPLVLAPNLLSEALQAPDEVSTTAGIFNMENMQHKPRTQSLRRAYTEQSIAALTEVLEETLKHNISAISKQGSSSAGIPASFLLKEVDEIGFQTVLLKGCGTSWNLDLMSLRKNNPNLKDNLLFGVGLTLLLPLIQRGGGSVEDGESEIQGITRDKYDICLPEQLYKFLVDIQTNYKNNLYHNNCHGATVAHLALSMAKMQGIRQYSRLGFDFLAASDKSLISPKMGEFLFIIAALSHDVGHPGLTNAFLINSRATLAIIYNDISVLENYHTSMMFSIVARRKQNILSRLNKAEFAEVRKRIIELILSTDMAKHFHEINELRLRSRSADFNPSGSLEDGWMIAKGSLKIADIGHGMLEWEQHREWTMKVVEEFCRQGDQEENLGFQRSPLCTRQPQNVLANSQSGFLSFVVKPLLLELQATCPTNTVGEVCGRNLENNILRWKQEAGKSIKQSESLEQLLTLGDKK